MAVMGTPLAAFAFMLSVGHHIKGTLTGEKKSFFYHLKQDHQKGSKLTINSSCPVIDFFSTIKYSVVCIYGILKVHVLLLVTSVCTQYLSLRGD